MLPLIDANVTTPSDTRASEPEKSSEDVAYDLEQSKRDLFVVIPSKSSTVTVVPSHGVHSETEGIWQFSGFHHDWLDVSVEKAWDSLHKDSWLASGPLDRLTGATKPTSTTVSSVAKLLRHHHRDERLGRMSAERRALYDGIMKLRDEIGPIGLDISRVLREIREE